MRSRGSGPVASGRIGAGAGVAARPVCPTSLAGGAAVRSSSGNSPAVLRWTGATAGRAASAQCSPALAWGAASRRGRKALPEMPSATREIVAGAAERSNGKGASDMRFCRPKGLIRPVALLVRLSDGAAERSSGKDAAWLICAAAPPPVCPRVGPESAVRSSGSAAPVTVRGAGLGRMPAGAGVPGASGAGDQARRSRAVVPVCGCGPATCGSVPAAVRISGSGVPIGLNAAGAEPMPGRCGPARRWTVGAPAGGALCAAEALAVAGRCEIGRTVCWEAGGASGAACRCAGPAGGVWYASVGRLRRVGAAVVSAAGSPAIGVIGERSSTSRARLGKELGWAAARGPGASPEADGGAVLAVGPGWTGASIRATSDRAAVAARRPASGAAGAGTPGRAGALPRCTKPCGCPLEDPGCAGAAACPGDADRSSSVWASPGRALPAGVGCVPRPAAAPAVGRRRSGCTSGAPAARITFGPAEAGRAAVPLSGSALLAISALPGGAAPARADSLRSDGGLPGREGGSCGRVAGRPACMSRSGSGARWAVGLGRSGAMLPRRDASDRETLRASGAFAPVVAAGLLWSGAYSAAVAFVVGLRCAPEGTVAPVLAGGVAGAAASSGMPCAAPAALRLRSGAPAGDTSAARWSESATGRSPPRPIAAGLLGGASLFGLVMPGPSPALPSGLRSNSAADRAMRGSRGALGPGPWGREPAAVRWAGAGMLPAALRGAAADVRSAGVRGGAAGVSAEGCGDGAAPRRWTVGRAASGAARRPAGRTRSSGARWSGASAGAGAPLAVGAAMRGSSGVRRSVSAGSAAVDATRRATTGRLAAAAPGRSAALAPNSASSASSVSDLEARRAISGSGVLGRTALRAKRRAIRLAHEAERWSRPAVERSVAGAARRAAIRPASGVAGAGSRIRRSGRAAPEARGSSGVAPVSWLSMWRGIVSRQRFPLLAPAPRLVQTPGGSAPASPAPPRCCRSSARGRST